MPAAFHLSLDITFGNSAFCVVIPEEAFVCRDGVIARVKSELSKLINKLIRSEMPEKSEEVRSAFYTGGLGSAIFKDQMYVHARLRSPLATHETLVHYIDTSILPRYPGKVSFSTVNEVKDPFSQGWGVYSIFTGGQEAFAAAWWAILVSRLISSSAPHGYLPDIAKLIEKSESQDKALWYHSTDRANHVLLWKNRSMEPEVWKWLLYSDGPYNTGAASDFTASISEQLVDRARNIGIYDLIVKGGS